MRPRIAITAPCRDEFGWALELAAESDGDLAIDVRVEDDTVWRVPEATRWVSGRLPEIELRYHFPVGSFDFSARDADQAMRGFLAVVEAIDGVAAVGGRFMTIHLTLGDEHAGERLDLARERLGELTRHAEERGVTLCLENLRWGLTSDPEVFASLVEETGCGVTFDVGHANSSAAATRSGAGPVDFVRRVAPRIRNAHVYDREDPHHIAPSDLDRIGPTLLALLETGCDWWVIELFGREEVISTRAMLAAFLGEHAAREVAS